MEVRNAEETELDHLAKLWLASWRDAHADLVPAELVRLRTLDSFRDRLAAAIQDVRVVGPVGEPLGFCVVKGDELYQLFVAAEARGTGVAAALIADAEALLAAKGVRTGWLACAIGNDRAAKFYEKCGWHRAGKMINEAETSEGVFPLEVWRYEKTLGKSAGVSYHRADVAMLRELLTVFGEVFEEPETYQGAVPDDDYLRSLIDSDNFIPLVAVDDGVVVGGLAAYVLRKFEQKRSEIYIYDLAVSEEYRRRGIATGLINELRSIGREIGAWVIFVQADHGDDPAIALYESLGVREDVLHFDIRP